MKRDASFLKQNLIAHRGYHNLEKGIPENSLKSFEEAISNDLIIELDVRLTKDRKVVVFHDDNLIRMTDINKNIKDLNYQEIVQIRLKKTNEKIPLLQEVLDLVKGRVPLIIELKSDGKNRVLEKEVIKLLKNYKGKYAIKSFNPLIVNYFKRKSPNTIRGQLATDYKNKNMCKLKKYLLSRMLFNFISKPDFISYDIRALPNNKITKLRKNKIILGWTIRNNNDLEKAKKYCDNAICENIRLHK